MPENDAALWPPNIKSVIDYWLQMGPESCRNRIKNALRSTMGQDRLTNLTLMTIECEIVQQLDFQDIVDSFSIVKARRKKF